MAIEFDKRSYFEWLALGVDPASKWCGKPKARTVDCDGCELLKVIDGREWCIYGVGKVLDQTEDPRACVLLEPKTKKPRKKWPLHSRFG